MAILPSASGINWELEDIADSMLARGRRGGVTSTDNHDYLSPCQLTARETREVYNKNGFPEPHLFSGLAKRVYNPLMGTRSSGKRSEE